MRSMKKQITLLIVFCMTMVSLFSQGKPNQEIDGGTITSDIEGTICPTSPKDSKVKIKVSGKKGKATTYMMLNSDEIIEIMQKSGVFDLEGHDPGIVTFYHVSYDKDDFNGSEGLAFADLSGTYDLSNPIDINIAAVESTAISFPEGGDGIIVCTTGDSINVNIEGELADNNAWILTDKSGKIVAIPESMPLDPGSLPDGRLSLYHINVMGDISGLSVGSRLNKLEGCYALSNELLLESAQPEAGTIQGDSLFFCIGNNSPDKIHGNDIKLVGADKGKGKGQWIVTDTAGIITDLPKTPQQMNFDRQDSSGICYLWYLVSANGLQGLEIGSSIDSLEGCFDLSNNLVIVKSLANGGHLENGIVKVCVESDTLITIPQELFELTDTAGGQYYWVVTTRNKHILGFADTLDKVDLTDAGTDKVFVYHLAYSDDMEGLEIGNRINELTGCFDFSNQVPVNIESAVASELSGEVFITCNDDTTTNEDDDEDDDDEEDEEEDDENFGDNKITLDTSGLIISGGDSLDLNWILTDGEGNIISRSDDPSMFNVGDTIPDSLYLYAVSGKAKLKNGENIDSLDGCFGLSNGIPVGGNTVDGGTLEGGPFGFCLDDGNAVIDSGAVVLTGESGELFTWVVTDSSGTIIALADSPQGINFADLGDGTCYLWHLAYDAGVTGIEIDSLVSNLSGCYDFSNSIEVVKDQPDGGVLEGGPFEFCASTGDGSFIPTDSITLTDNIGMNSQWVVTDTSGRILSLPGSPYDVDFSLAPAGLCQVWHLSYATGLVGLEIDSLVSNLEGCYDFSNAIDVTKTGGEGGTLEGGPFSFCVGDGIVDNIPADSITLTGNDGANSQWVVTDLDGKILGLPANPSDVNFDEAEPGTCLVWHLSYDDELIGLEVDSLVSNLEGCYDFSNAIEVFRDSPDGGSLEGGPFGFCTTDTSVVTLVEGAITLSGELGPNLQWVITDLSGNISALPTTPYEVDYIALGSDTSLIWHLAYVDGLAGLEVGNDVNALDGCYDFSDSIAVVLGGLQGGILEGGPFAFCVGDGVQDTIPTDAIILSDTVGINYQWVITDTSGVILDLPASPYEVDFETAPAGICLFWHLAYDDGLTGLEIDSLVSNLEGCYNFSNSIMVNREDPDGGMLDGGPFTFCVGDGVIDTIGVDEITLLNSSGSNQQFVITDTSGIILALPDDIHTYDFDGAGEGRNLIWNIAYQDGIIGLEVDSLVANLDGCYNLSDSIIVDKNAVFGGSIALPSGAVDTVFCADDGTDDLLDPILSGAVGENSQWLMTDSAGIITVIQDTVPYNFEGSLSGEYSFWHISSNGAVEGLEVDSVASGLEGCFDLSNAINATIQTGDECVENAGFTLDEEEGRVALSARQNPVQDRLMLDIETEGAVGMGYLLVRDMSGITMVSKNIQIVDVTSVYEELNTSEWKDGMYFITITFPGETKSIKILKQK